MKKRKFSSCFFASLVALTALSCSGVTTNTTEDGTLDRYDFANILDVRHTPSSGERCTGWFADLGSWMGFTLSENDQFVNGFCGPYSIDMPSRRWMAQSAVVVGVGDKKGAEGFKPIQSTYYPGELLMQSEKDGLEIEQRLNFTSSTTALLSVNSNRKEKLSFQSLEWDEDVKVQVNGCSVVAKHPSGESVIITFPSYVVLQSDEDGYIATCDIATKECNIAISFAVSDYEILPIIEGNAQLLIDTQSALTQNRERWDGYISSVLRDDLTHEYDRVAVKSVVTLTSNWRSQRGGLLHDGVVPSHAVDYFVGFWAWDSWRFVAALSKFNPQLAKNNIRAMFDYQLEDGMIIDCIYTNPKENNARDSKPPLICWAVEKIYDNTGDTDFLSEMFPQLVAYHNWWYEKRDHDKNGICEFGSTDGTLVAAAWESGMDNAIRFDDTKMLKNSGYNDAWSMNQESVDLNSYLAIEYRCLKKFAEVLNRPLDIPEVPANIADHFYDKESGFFFDKRLSDGSFVKEYGCEAYTPLWAEIATKEQVEAMLPLLTDTTKFSTYIPFPTVAADNPKYNPRGYWRGPIWLDQTHLAIRGLRNYGYG